MPGPRRQAGGAAEAIDAAEGDGRIDFRQVKRQAVAAAAKEAETSPLCAEEAAGGGDGGLPWSIQAGLAHLSSEECRMKDLIKVLAPADRNSFTLHFSAPTCALPFNKEGLEEGETGENTRGD